MQKQSSAENVVFSTNGVGSVDYIYATELNFDPHWLKMDHTLGKPKTLELLEENIGENLTLDYTWKNKLINQILSKF